MLNALTLERGRLVPLAENRLAEALEDATWVDLIDPDTDERDRVQRLYRQELPETEDVDEIEASARFYEDAGGLHIHSLFLQEVEDRPRNTSVAFTVTRERLFSLREREIPAFRLVRMRARRTHTRHVPFGTRTPPAPSARRISTATASCRADCARASIVAPRVSALARAPRATHPFAEKDDLWEEMEAMASMG